MRESNGPAASSTPHRPSATLKSVTPALGTPQPSEHGSGTDPATGTTIHQLTSAACINHAPFFLTSAFTPDERHVLFTSYRSGTPQLYEVELLDGPIRRLTDVEGLHPYSAVIAADGSEVLYTRSEGGAEPAGVIEAVSRRDLSRRVIHRLPGAQLAECSVSADGAWVVTAMKRHGRHGLLVAATSGETGRVALEFPRTVIHPQFHPVDADWIEFAGDPAPRMFRVRRDGTGLACLYEHDNDEFVVHETFLGRSDVVFVEWPRALRRLRWDSGEVDTIARLNAWHIAPNRAGTRIVCDTNHPDRGLLIVDVATGEWRVVCHPRSSNGGTQWRTSRYALAEDFARAARAAGTPAGASGPLSWMESPTDTVYGPQWSHPHPAFSPSERYVSYTSDAGGFPQVYLAEL